MKLRDVVVEHMASGKIKKKKMYKVSQARMTTFPIQDSMDQMAVIHK